MKRFAMIFVFFAVVAFAGGASAGDWKKLGDKTASVWKNSVTIRVNDFKKYDYIKLQVRDKGLEFRKVVVTFGNGEEQELAVRKFISKGGETIPWRLEGGDRFVRSVHIDYKARAGDEKARVTVYGKRS